MVLLLLLLIAAGGALVLIGRPDAGEPAGTSDAASYPSSSPGTAGPEAASAGEGAGAGTPIPTSRRGRTHRPGPKVVEPTPELTGGGATSETSSHAPIGSGGDPVSPAPAAPAVMTRRARLPKGAPSASPFGAASRGWSWAHGRRFRSRSAIRTTTRSPSRAFVLLCREARAAAGLLRTSRRAPRSCRSLCPPG